MVHLALLLLKPHELLARAGLALWQRFVRRIVVTAMRHGPIRAEVERIVDRRIDELLRGRFELRRL